MNCYRIFLISIVFFLSNFVNSQNVMNIHLSNGTVETFDLDVVDSMNFTLTPPPEQFHIYDTNGYVTSFNIVDIDSITYGLLTPLLLPIVTSNEVNSITINSAVVVGEVLDQAGGFERGVVWSQSPSPTLLDSVQSEMMNLGVFSIQLTDLQPSTSYYARAYATNNEGTSYGTTLSFQTLDIEYLNPSLNYNEIIDIDGNSYNTIVIGNQEWMAENLRVKRFRNLDSITNITIPFSWSQFDTTAYCYFNNDPSTPTPIGLLYNGNTIVDERGLCPVGWHVPKKEEWEELLLFIDSAPQITNNYVAADDLKSSEEGFYWLAPNSANNSTGMSVLPGGWRYYLGDFEQEMSEARLWSSTIMGLSEMWYMHFSFDSDQVIVASMDNRSGASVRCVKDYPPQVTTIEPNNISDSEATSGGEVTDEANYPVTEKGIVWSISPNPTITNNDGITVDGSGMGAFSSQLTNLYPNTQYYVRAYATNIETTSYGDEFTLTTEDFAFPTDFLNPSFTYNTISDIEGNVYHTLVIGSQEWMIDNLRTATFANGDPIPEIPDNLNWINATNAAWCSYSNDTSYQAPFGKLYNWYATVDSRNICPTNWHVPTDDEWNILIHYFEPWVPGDATGQQSLSLGGELKSIGTTYFNSPNTGATNSIGFSALPGGFRGNGGLFEEINIVGWWWTLTEDIDYPNSSYYRSVNYSNAYLYRNSTFKREGLSVRCVRD